MNLRQLEQFIEIVERGSIGKASRSLNISQPALTKSLRQLETQLGISLLSRTAYGVQLTTYGESLFEHAKRVKSEISLAGREIESLKSARKGKVVVGTIPFVCNALLPLAITRLTRMRPSISVTIIEKSNAELMTSFRQGDFDFLVSILDEHELEPHHQSKILFSDDLVPVVRPDHPLMELREASVKDLASYPWIYPKPGSAHRRRLDDLFKTAGVSPVQLVEGGAQPFVAAILMQSDCVAAMSDGGRRLDLNTTELAVVKTDMKILPRPVGLLHRGTKSLSPSAKLLIAEIERACRTGRV